jgi:YebC/PmpR family DNA-binding regulatory protein
MWYNNAMSGHSKWSTIKRQKGVADAKRGAIFTKIGNQIAIAARSGTDPKMNPSLALAIEKAKAANMPAANVQRSIARVADKSAAQLKEATYEAYGPGGVGIVLEAATDNTNRTFPQIRSTLSKNGGSIAESGSVLFQFDRVGVIHVDSVEESALLTVLEAGASDAIDDEDEIVAYTEPKTLSEVRQKIIDSGLRVAGASLEYVPKVKIDITDPEKQGKILKLLDALDDLEDVSAVYTNADV